MKLEEILKFCDHTVLSPAATWEQIRTAIDDAITFDTASVCIPPAFVKRAHEYAVGKTSICTVIGFPNGYSKTDIKVFEAKSAALDGADEIDMVINIGMLKEGNYDAVLDEINEIKSAVGEKILKVIIETCLLTEEEKLKMCEIVSKSNADFIKTSTGFSTAGATRADVELLCRNIGSGKRVKAAGGIASLEDAECFINLGAQRLGTSRIVGLAKKENEKSTY